MNGASTIYWNNNVVSWDDTTSGFRCISTLTKALSYHAGFSFKGYYGLQLRTYGGTTDKFTIRGHNASSWGAWREITHSGNSNLTTIDWSAKNLILAGGITGATIITASGIASLTNTTQSTAYTNGALVLSGGLGIAKDLYSNGKAVFASYIQGAYYKLGNWEIKQNASGELEFILSGSLKFKITSTGIVSSGGVAFYS
jgi:hypothetical protein